MQPPALFSSTHTKQAFIKVNSGQLSSADTNESAFTYSQWAGHVTKKVANFDAL